MQIRCRAGNHSSNGLATQATNTQAPEGTELGVQVEQSTRAAVRNIQASAGTSSRIAAHQRTGDERPAVRDDEERQLER
jgi:hypothetical protein